MKKAKTSKKTSGKGRGDVTRIEPYQFKKGESGNPNGRPKGQRNFRTIYREALIKIGELKDQTADDVELALGVKAVEMALKGNYQFYQDIQDRIHGKPVQTNLTKNIDDLEIDESEMQTMDAMLARFVKVKTNGNTGTNKTRKGTNTNKRTSKGKAK